MWEDNENLDDEIANQMKSDCGQDAGHTVVVLITKDGNFADLVAELKLDGVTVYLMSPPDANGKLLSEVGKKRWIPMDKLGQYHSVQNFGIVHYRNFQLS